MPAANELAVIASLCCVATYDRASSGTVAALRFVGGSATRLDNPSGLAYRSASDELFVGDVDTPSGGGKIVVFARTASGNVPPSRTIVGSNTQLGAWVYALAAHPTLPEIYALAEQDSGGGETAGSIVTFSASADGNATPLRVIAGSNTHILNGIKFAYDSRTDEFIVGAGASSVGGPALLVFPRTTQGNVVPSRVLTGSNTGLSDAYGLLAASLLDTIFRDGFEPAGP